MAVGVDELDAGLADQFLAAPAGQGHPARVDHLEAPLGRDDGEQVAGVVEEPARGLGFAERRAFCSFVDRRLGHSVSRLSFADRETQP